MLGGTITGANGDVLLGAAWMLYFYFFWMYWRAAQGYRPGSSFSNDMSVRMRESIKELKDRMFDQGTKANQLAAGSGNKGPYVLSRKGFSFYLTPNHLRSQSIGDQLSVGSSAILWRFYLKSIFWAALYGDWVPKLLIPYVVAGAAFLCFLLSVYRALLGN